jgi:threonine/homoserine/homoserine lactone efflux protein
MIATSSLPLFLASVIGISLTGVMMPGPVTAVTVAKGSQRKAAGVLIALGHGLVELPLIVLIYLGFGHFLTLEEVKISVGLAGGLLLLWMALQMLKIRPLVFDEGKDMSHGSVIAGLATTAANPYFFVWWATVGAALLTSARAFGSTGVVALGATHWLCDLGWLFFVSWAVFKSRRLWTQRVHRVAFGVCAAILAGFGAWFIFSGLDLAIRG